MDYNKYLPYIAGLSYSSIFGFSFMFTKISLGYIPPFQLLGFRFGVAAIVFTLLYLFKLIKLDYHDKNMGLLFLLALFQPVFYFIFETMGIKYSSSSEAGLMISLIPVIVTMLAVIVLKERPSKKQLIFIMLSVSGVIFIILMKGQLDVKKHYFGMLLLGGAILMAGLYSILSRLLSLNYKPVEITFVMIWSGAIVFNIIALFMHQGDIMEYLIPLQNFDLFLSVLYLGILSSMVAFFLLNFTLSRIKASQSSVFSNLVTVISIIAGIVFLGENFFWFQIIGGIMIITGVWGTNYYGKIEKRAEKISA